MGSSDIETIKDAGLDKFLSRVKSAGKIANPFTKYTEATNISGGTLGNNAIFNVGSKQVKIDGPKSRITVNDGVNDRILFGKREDGTFGIDVSSSGFDVHSAYEAEMDLSSKSKDDWTEFDPALFSYGAANKINITTITPSDWFQVGDKIKLVQSSVSKYFYVIKIEASDILIDGRDAGVAWADLANESITSIYRANKSDPSGFPEIMTYPTTLTNEHDTAIGYISDGFAMLYYNMIGNNVIGYIQIVGADIPASTNTVEMTTPFKFISYDSSFAHIEYVRINNTTMKDVVVQYISSEIYSSAVIQYYNSAGDYATGNFEAYNTINFVI